MTDPFAGAEYAPWLETVVKDMVELKPVCIQMAMRDAEGRVYTSYWCMDANDRACIMDAIKTDGFLEFLRDNREAITEILNESEDDEDGLCEADPETDSEG